MPDNPKLPVPSEGESTIELFQRKGIRRVFHNNEWWYAVIDVIARLTDSKDPNGYLFDMRRRDKSFAEAWRQIAAPLIIETPRGRQRANCANIEGIFRILQSVPSKHAEPFKKWLAKNAFERIQEIQDPELAIKRAIHLYKAQGYDDPWIDARIRSIVSRKELTDEWKRRGMTSNPLNIAVLSDAISVETFDVKIKEHREIKGLKTSNQNLRDNMTPIELTLTTLGEQATTEISKASSPTTFQQNLNVAKRGGSVAGTARKQLEQETGQKVVSPTNYLTERQKSNNAKEFAKFDQLLQRMLNVPPVQNKDLKGNL